MKKISSLFVLTAWLLMSWVLEFQATALRKH